MMTCRCGGPLTLDKSHISEARTIRMPGDDSLALEVLPLRPLALARPVDDA